MKKRSYLCIAALSVLAACGTQKPNANNDSADTTASKQETAAATTDSLTAKMDIADTIAAGEPVSLRFTVLNQNSSDQKFCKWHTPFEPLISKYLEVTNEKGVEMDYKGAMAKRIMPPPQDSYITVKAADTLSVTTDVLKGYALTGPGKYTIKYVGSNMSGLKAPAPATFIYK